MIRHKTVYVALLMISARAFADFDDGCGGLYTYQLTLYTKVCAQSLADRQGVEVPGCETLLNEAERVNAFLDSHDLASAKDCTPEKIRTIQRQIVDAAAVLDRARARESQ